MGDDEQDASVNMEEELSMEASEEVDGCEDDDNGSGEL